MRSNKQPKMLNDVDETKKGVAKNGFKLRLDEGARICKVINETSQAHIKIQQINGICDDSQNELRGAGTLFRTVDIINGFVIVPCPVVTLSLFITF